jgi:ribonuclease P protein component
VNRGGRLRKGREFDTVYRQGTATSGPLVVVRALPNALEDTRWGFAVGKRLAKQAVVLNRTKRRLREAARMLPVRAGEDIIVTARGRSTEAPYRDLRAALERVLRRAGLLEGPPER